MFNPIIRGVKYKLFPVKNIAQALDVKLAISSKMEKYINNWLSMFAEDHGLCLPAAIASELARLVTIENEIEISGSARADFLKQQFMPLKNSLRSFTEFGIAGGGLIFKPYLDNHGIGISYIKANACYPIAFDSSGKLSSIVFLEQINKDSRVYTRLEYHHVEPQGCIIENKAFVTSTLNLAVLGEPIVLNKVAEWAQLEPKIRIENVNRLLVGYFKMPLANNIDPQSPLGVSGYSRATELIAQANEQWQRIMWEFKGSELAVHAAESLFKKVDGTITLPQGMERQYRLIRGDIDGANKITTYSPAIRDVSLFNGFNNILKRIEFSCGLAYGTLSDPQNIDKTAEEIKASKQRSYALVRDIQKSLEAAINDLIYAMDIWATLADLAPSGAYKTAYDWDDSIISDPQERKKLYWQYVQSGKFPFWRYLVEFESYTEQDAKEISTETQGLGGLYAAT